MNAFLYPSMGLLPYPNLDIVELFFESDYYNNNTHIEYKPFSSLKSILESILESISLDERISLMMLKNCYYDEIKKLAPNKFDIDIQDYINLYNNTLCLISAEFNSYIRAVFIRIR